MKEKYGSLVEITRHTDKKGVRVSRQLIEAAFDTFAEWNCDFYKHTNLLPLAYSEQQISGGLFSSIAQSGYHVLSQPPIRRKRWGEEECHGWADYVVYNDNTMFLLELKHAQCQYMKYKKTELDWIKGNWEKSVEQVKSFRRNTRETWGKDWPLNVGLTLNMVLVYQLQKNKEDISVIDKNDAMTYFAKILKKLSPKPEWIWLWQLNNQTFKSKHYLKWENYPVVFILVYLKHMH